MPQPNLFGEDEPPPLIERPPEWLVRELIELGCDSDKANQFGIRQAHAVLNRLRQRAARSKQSTAAGSLPARAGRKARAEPPQELFPAPARADEPEPDFEEPMRWHLFPWDRPAISTVIEGLEEMARMPPEVVLPRCVFWAIRHLSPSDLHHLIHWLQEVLIDARGRIPPPATSGADRAASAGGTDGMVDRDRPDGNPEALLDPDQRGRDSPPHIADAGITLARFAPHETESEPESVDSAFDEWA